MRLSDHLSLGLALTLKWVTTQSKPSYNWLLSPMSLQVEGGVATQRCLPGSQQYVRPWHFAPVFQVLGHYVTYFFRIQVASTVELRPKECLPTSGVDPPKRIDWQQVPLNMYPNPGFLKTPYFAAKWGFTSMYAIGCSLMLSGSCGTCGAASTWKKAEWASHLLCSQCSWILH